MKKAMLTLGFLCMVLGMNAQVKGYVYEDTNQNGKKDKNEKGIEKVAVTNGTEVVLTDFKGIYEMPIGDDNIVSVIKPAGYIVPKDKNNLPGFYYIHKPKGSPKLKFNGVPPTGKLPKSVDFALYPSNETEEFTALVFGDPQPYDLKEVEYFSRGVVSEVAGIKDVSFGLSMGDLVGNDLDLFNPYIEATEKVGIPWYNLMGNHDMNFDAKDDKLSDETYEAHFGPNNYAFNYGKVHFIILDDIIYPDPRDDEKYWGGFREDQLDFVANDLRYVPKDHLVVLAFHIPLFEAGDRDLFVDEDRQKLFDLLKDYPNTLSLSAHTHMQRQYFFGKEDGLNRATPHHEYNVGTTSGNWYSGRLNEGGIPLATMADGTPKGYAFIHFKDNQYKIAYKAAGKPKDFQMRIFNPKIVAKGRNTAAGIYVNFFMGSQNDTVEYRVDGGEWKQMDYVIEADPSYIQIAYEWDMADMLFPGRRPSNPADCTHLWKAKIPTKLEEGEHKIEIKARDMFGQDHFGESGYRLIEPQ